MNVYQTLNTGGLALTAGGIVTGLSKMPIAIENWPISLYLFAAFFLFLRLKTYLDDYQYFASADTASPNFKIGFIAGFTSWVLWGLSANAVSKPLEAYFLLGIAITVSTLWILVDGLWRGATRAQYFWIGSNAAFVALLWGAYRRNRPDGDFVTATIFGFALVLLIADFIFSKSLPDLNKTPAK